MALALVKLSRMRGDRIEYFIDYISYDVAKLGVCIQGEKHEDGEFSKAEIIKVFNNSKINKTKI
jgi:hypothetical protein